MGFKATLTSSADPRCCSPRWEDLRAYVAIDGKKVLNSLGIMGKWYNVGFPEDKTGSSEVKISWADSGKSIPDEPIKKQCMELAVVCADGKYCKGLGRLTTAFCLQYVDFLNAKRKVSVEGGYTYIIATLGKKQGSVNPKFARILGDFGFKKANLTIPPPSRACYTLLFVPPAAADGPRKLWEGWVRVGFERLSLSAWADLAAVSFRSPSRTRQENPGSPAGSS